MGYSTDFSGQFDLDKPLDPETHTFLTKLANTRRMKRDLPPEYGVEGEFFVDGKGFMGQDDDDSVLNHNQPPSTQPGLWCQWEPNKDGTAIVWDEAEKFYDYIEWIKYLIDAILKPRGYSLTGTVTWFGEDPDDRGQIVIEDNKVTVKHAVITYQ